MSLLGRIFGSDESQAQPQPTQARTTDNPVPAPGQTNLASSDEIAVARYRYLLRTAPPETLEQAHEEAFARLTPEQRRLALQQLAQSDPEAQHATSDDPQTLARLATRAEVRQPGFLERTFGGVGMGVPVMGGGMMGGGGIGMGGIIAGSLLSSVAGSLIGGAIAHSFFSNPVNMAGFAQSGLMPGGMDTGDTIINNNYYGDGAAADDTSVGTVAGDANTDTNVGSFDYDGNDAATGGYFDTSGASDTFTDAGGDFGGDLGGDF